MTSVSGPLPFTAGMCKFALVELADCKEGKRFRILLGGCLQGKGLMTETLADVRLLSNIVAMGHTWGVKHWRCDRMPFIVN